MRIIPAMKLLRIVLLICVIAVSLLIVSCGSRKNVVLSQTHSERSSIKTHHLVKWLTDTVYIEIPAQTAERTTRDSASHLENEYAVSEAAITADGSLWHTLATKPQKRAQPYKRAVESRDSIVYVATADTVPQIVYRDKPLTRWQSVRLDTWGWLLAALLLSIAGLFRKPLYRLCKYILQKS